VLGDEITPAERPAEVRWHEQAPEGKLDLLVTLDFRMSTTCVYSDVVLPSATWYEKNDLNTTDMHPFIHPLSRAVDPPWEARSDWQTFAGFARAFSAVCPEVLGVEHDLVLSPLAHDTPAELGQPLTVQDWKLGECAPVPGRTAPGVALVERDYPAVGARFTSLGPLLAKLGNGGKGITWNTETEVAELGDLNGRTAIGQPSLENDIDAAEAILMLAPETNGEVAMKAWQALERSTGGAHKHLAHGRADEKIRFRDLQAQPRKIITSPIWSGLESERVCYNAGYTNVHEHIPWRTLSGRQELYQDHLWMRAFGEALPTWRPPVDTSAVAAVRGRHASGAAEVVLNFSTPHQKWGFHSSYSENLLMLTLGRGGPVIWLSEEDAATAGIADNDWVEAYNGNGTLVARAIVSQRIMPGMTLMYHAQDRIVNIPGSEITRQRGGIHNSVTRTALKPTHMIGGYVHLAYGFNYYGTVGSNRDEFVIVRRMQRIDWLDGSVATTQAATEETAR
jgi:nitrate reductase alpha subunit